MRILAIEASARVAGVAFLENGRILAEQMVNGPLTHSETLMPMVESVVELAGKTPEDIEYIAVTCGPGSFTGLRIGAATAKGLALGLQVPIVAVSTLEAAAYNARLWPGLVVPVMDARRGQVYGAVYEKGEVLRQPEAVSPEELANWLAGQEKDCLFVGDAADLYSDFFKERLGERWNIAAPCHKDLRAGVLAALAESKLKAGEESVSGSALELEYLRKPQAEREREARLAAEGKAI